LEILMKALGMVLVVLGLLGLLYGGLSWTRREKIIDAGPIQVSKDKHEFIPLPPVAGGAALVAGVLLLLKGKA
jgi:xanthosine utilization system XapX-like protein